MQEAWFPVGRIATGVDLVGREGAIADLSVRLAAGQHTMLAGPRRTGKTSVATAVLERLASEGLQVGTVDCMRVATVRELSSAVEEATLSNLGPVVQATADVRKWLRGATPTVEWKTAFGADAELALSVTLGTGAGREDPFGALQRALDGFEEVAGRKRRRGVLMFDEFQELPKIDAGILRRMRSVVMHHAHVAFLFLGSQRSAMEVLFSRAEEPFYRFAVPWEVPAVPESTWSAYVAAKLTDLGYAASDAAVREIVARAGAHPMDTMMLANETVFTAISLGTRTVGLDVVALAVERVLISQARAFEEAWQRMDPARQHVVRRLCRGEGPYAGPAPNHGRVRASIAKLLDAGTLSRGVGRGRYIFVEPMFAEHVRRHYLA